jgi:hypothetical protein
LFLSFFPTGTAGLAPEDLAAAAFSGRRWAIEEGSSDVTGMGSELLDLRFAGIADHDPHEAIP